MRTKHVCALIILFVISGILAPVSAVSLPQCGSQVQITVCVVSYTVAPDMKSAVLTGAISESWTTVRILNVTGLVQDQDGLTLGTGQMLNGPVDVQANVPASGSILIQSPYTPTQLHTLPVQSVTVYITGYYCLPYQFWFVSGCLMMPAYHYQVTYTTQQLWGFYNYYAPQGGN